MLAIGAVALLLAALVVLAAKDRLLAGGFIVGAVVCIALFQGVAAGIWLARKAERAAAALLAPGRLALANLHRPGAPTGAASCCRSGSG